MSSKTIKITTIIIIVLTIIINIIAMSNRVVFIDNEKSEILKERFDLPEHSRVLITIIPRSFFRPYFKMVYLDDIICTMDTGKIGEAGDSAFSILPDMIEADIFEYIWIFNIVMVVIIMGLREYNYLLNERVKNEKE